eukprot:g24973.t1
MELPPLPPKSTTREQLVPSFRGPTKRSNWVIPGRLMAGDRSSLDTEETLQAVLRAGVTCIVCLQSRQETSSAVDYKKRARAFRPSCSFLEQPIPDQEVADDAVISELLTQLLERLQSEVLYVHCRGGHGRTGTICALLLAKLYNISAAEAMARAQLYHDVRQQPVFCAEGYQETNDGSSCVILFPSQRQQVIRLLRAEGTGTAVVLDRASSALYGPGASKYSLELMTSWQEKAKAAADALNKGKKTKNEEPICVCIYMFVKFGARRARLRQQRKQELEKMEPKVLKEEQPSASASAASAAEPVAEEAAGPVFSWKPKVSKPMVLMLVGLPGSGKSTFAEQLVKSGQGFERVCQDELSGRDAFERAIGPVAKEKMFAHPLYSVTFESAIDAVKQGHKAYIFEQVKGFGKPYDMSTSETPLERFLGKIDHLGLTGGIQNRAKYWHITTRPSMNTWMNIKRERT